MNGKNPKRKTIAIVKKKSGVPICVCKDNKAIWNCKQFEQIFFKKNCFGKLFRLSKNLVY